MNRFARAGLLSALLISASPIAVAAANYTSVWSLGDSLSDTGRTYGYLSSWYLRWTRKPYGPHYHNGRFSNGPVWTEYLGGEKGQGGPGVNYAWGGAITGTTAGSGMSWFSNKFANWMIPSLEKQVDNYMLPAIGAAQPQASGAPVCQTCFGSNPLVTLWIGGNNFRVPGESAPSGSARDGYLMARDFIINNVPAALKTIHQAFVNNANRANGERPASITYYTPTTPDVSLTPKFAGLDAASKKELSEVIGMTNRELKLRLIRLGDQLASDRTPGRIVIVDTAAMMEEIMANPADFNLINARDNCISSDSGEYVGACNPQNANSYLYWDEFHPTTYVHAQLAEFSANTDRLESGLSVRLALPHVANVEWRDLSYGGDISGPGRLIKRGEAMLTLAGNNTYAGGTRFDDGVVRVFSARNLGAPDGDLVFRGGTLRASGAVTLHHTVRLAQPASGDTNGVSGAFSVDRGYTLTLVGPMLAGNGNLAKTGPGALDIRSRIETARERTDIHDGELLINSPDLYESSVINVASGASLGGGGRVKGDIHNNGQVRTTSCGGSLTVLGDFQQTMGGTIILPTGKTQVRNGCEGSRSSIHVQGHARLGGVVSAAIRAEKFLSSQRTVIRADSGVSGAFSGAETSSPFVGIALSQNDTAVTATLSRNFSLPATTGNQKAVATFLNGVYSEAAQGDLDRVLLALDLAGPREDAQRALDALSGASLGKADEAIATHASAMQRSVLAMAAASRRGSRTPAQPEAGVRQVGDVSIRAQMSTQPWRGARRSGAGQDAFMSAGLEKAWTIANGLPLTTGIAVTHGQMNAAWQGELRGMSASSLHVAGYATLTSGPYFADAVVGAGRTDGWTRRSFAFGDLREATRARHRATDTFASIRAGMTLDVGSLKVEPSAGLDWVRMARRGLRETGAGAASVLTGRRAAMMLTPSLNVDVSRRFALGGIVAEPAAWMRFQLAHARSDRMRHTLAGAPTASFSLDEAMSAKQAGSAMGARLGIAPNGEQEIHTRLFAAWERSRDSARAAHSFTAGLTATF
ncbi:autotransporter domain-containing protein [Camelimonas sp. ID_303_24]